MSERGALLSMLAGGEEAKFISHSSVLNTGGGPVTTYHDLSAGSIGDLAIVITQGNVNAPVGGPGTWTNLVPTSYAGGSPSRVMFHVIDAADLVANAVGVALDNGCNSDLLIYRDAAGVTLKSTTEDSSGANLTLPGFTIAANSAGVVAYITDAKLGTGFTGPATGGLALRYGPNLTGSHFSRAIYDCTAPTDYAEAALTWSGFATSGGFDHLGILLELTR